MARGLFNVKQNLRVHSYQRKGFTLMELMTVMIIISILALMVFSSVAGIRGKAERARCVGNLQSLYTASASYLLDHESWPQVPTIDVEAPEFSQAWIDALTPYQISLPNWTCEAAQKLIGVPADPNNPHIDYIPASFDPRPASPWRFPTQPWFIERADAHGDGNLLIFTNGQLHSLNELKSLK